MEQRERGTRQKVGVDVSSNVYPELVNPLQETLGFQAATNSIWDLENAKGFVVLTSNLTEDQGVVGVPIKKAVKTGSKLVVIDPRETELTRYSDISGNLFLLKGMAHKI